MKHFSISGCFVENICSFQEKNNKTKRFAHPVFFTFCSEQLFLFSVRLFFSAQQNNKVQLWKFLGFGQNNLVGFFFHESVFGKLALLLEKTKKRAQSNLTFVLFQFFL
jgi:hypothetical protein